MNPEITQRPDPYLVVVVSWLHGWLADPLHHHTIAEGNGEDGQQVGSDKLIEDEGPLVSLGGEPLHAVLPGTVPVPLLDTLVHEDRRGQDERA